MFYSNTVWFNDRVAAGGIEMKIYKKLWFKIVSVFIILIAVLFGTFFIYAADYYHATTVAVTAIAQEKSVNVTYDDNMIIFSPKQNGKDIGFVFYPGGKVEYTAYSPLMVKMAEQGITCILVKMPFNLAVFDSNGAGKAINKLDKISNWYIGGHSLGGAMASAYASSNADKLKGIVFLGAYPSSDLSKTNLKMLSIYGMEDKVLNKEKLDECRSNEPKNTKYLELKGANHANYGNYGVQSGDGTATISAEEQQDIAVKAIFDFIS